MEGIRILKRPKLRNPYLIVAWPGMGEVAFKAAKFLVDKLKAQEFASIRPEDFFYLSGSNIQQGILDLPSLPYSKFYYWKNPGIKSQQRSAGNKSDMIIFLSNAQPDLSRLNDYCRRIISVIKQFDIKMVICFAAMPLPIDHTQEPGVWGCATQDALKEMLLKHNLKIMPEGHISGMNGLFLGIAKKQGLEGICLLGEIPIYTIQIENPKAACSVLDALSKILNIPLETKELQQQADVINGQINQLVDYLKIGSQQPPPIGEEEIEKIKRSLSQYTKLPQSIKTRIDGLFKQAKSDISKATQLKQELDKWNVYKEYEDKFLDLFKKKKEKDNN